MITALLAIVVVILIYVIMTWKPRLHHIPGPPGNPIYGHLGMINMTSFHQQLEAWSKEHGPIMRLQLADKTRVATNDFDSIYKVLVSQGRDFAGRPGGRRAKWLIEDTGILLSTKADDIWRSLRKSAHQHLRQFGDGMSQLESVINEVAEDMFDVINDKAGQEFDPYQIVFDTALNSIAFLITGTRTHTGDPVVELMREFEQDGPRYLGTSNIKYFIYEILPSLRYFRLPGWSDIEHVMDIEADIWRLVKQFKENDPDLESLVTIMMDNAQAQHGNYPYKENDVRKTAISLLFAGVTTTSASFYAAINILAHNPKVQGTVHAEMEEVAGNRPVVLQDKPNLPYTHAFLLELFRYTSVVAMGVPHRAVRDVSLSGYHIPKDTIIHTNLWAMHHDEKFWGDPYEFRPERFLDEDKNIVAVDHPNRKHLMPFGAGTRVCLGESLAIARLFLWITTLIQRFEVAPAENNPKSATDPRLFDREAVVRVTRYDVVFKLRT